MEKCVKISEETLLCYVNRRLGAEERSAVILHIARCPSCREELAALLRLKALCDSSLPEPPPAFADGMFALVRAAEETKKTEDPLARSLRAVRESFAAVDGVLRLTRRAVGLAAQGLL